MPWLEVPLVCYMQLYLPSMCNVQLSHANCFELALAGGLTAVFVSPLEVLKTRLQTQVKGQGTKYLGGVHIYGTVYSFCSFLYTHLMQY